MSKLSFPWQKGDHTRVIKVIAEGMSIAGQLKNYLEIGVQRGRCFNEIAPLVHDKAYAIDIVDTHKYVQHNKNLVWYCGKSSDFFNKFSQEKFNLVFIDADHSHEASLFDFKSVLPMVTDGGMILLHDVYPPSKEFISDSYCGDSYRTAKHIRKYYSTTVEIVTLPFYFGIAVCRKTDKQLTWQQ